MPRWNPDRDPTPAQIAAACAEIRKAWTEEEEVERRHHNASQISLSTLLEARRGLEDETVVLG